MTAQRIRLMHKQIYADKRRDFMKNCPFCGKNKLKLEVKEANRGVYKGTQIFHRITSYVRCNCCHSRGPTESLLVPNADTDIIERIKSLAVKAWNDRKYTNDN